jgi:serine/threonine-protein kinase
MLAPDEELLNKYKISKTIGKGQFGRVYLAEEFSSPRKVAIKALRTDLPSSQLEEAEELFRPRKVAIKALRTDLPSSQLEEAQERFRREIEIGGVLAHPNIVRVLTSEQVGDTVYLVLDYMPGGSLRERLEQTRQLSVTEATQIALQIAEALGYLHQHSLDLVHRDVSPDNILFSGEGAAHLADFGVVQSPKYSGSRFETEHDRWHPVNPHYSPPEAWEPQVLSASADVYMLGAVLWEMLTGRNYNKEQNLPFCHFRTDVPDDLITIIERLNYGITFCAYRHEQNLNIRIWYRFVV